MKQVLVLLIFLIPVLESEREAVSLLLEQAALVAVRGLFLRAPVDLAVVVVRAAIQVLAVEALLELARAVFLARVEAAAEAVAGVMRAIHPVRAFSMLEAAEAEAA